MTVVAVVVRAVAAAVLEADVVVDVVASVATGVDVVADVVVVLPEAVVVPVEADVVVPQAAQRAVLRLSSSPTDTPVCSSLAARRISSSPRT